jgi:hypothetical protein
VGRQSESVRLELFSGQHALCRLVLFEGALLAVPDEDTYVLASITPDPNHHGSTPLSIFLSLRFLSRARPSPLVLCEDVKTVPKPHTPLSQAGTSSPAHITSRSTKALHNRTNSCLSMLTMNVLFSPYEANRGMLHLLRCTQTKPPDPVRAAAPSRPTTTPCNAEETKGAQCLIL